MKPVLLVNFLSLRDVFNFGTNSFTVLSSHNATTVGNIISATTSVTDSADDGFGIQFAGTFGPGTPLQFTYSSGGGPDGLATVAFTLGTPVPEPPSDSLAAMGTLITIGVFAARLGRRNLEKPVRNTRQIV